MINSAIYNGKVIHKRFKPKVHSFKYSVFSLFIDLSELETLDKKISFFSLNKFNLISFFEKDHGDRDGSSLIGWVTKQLQNYEINTDKIPGIPLSAGSAVTLIPFSDNLLANPSSLGIYE